RLELPVPLLARRPFEADERDDDPDRDVQDQDVETAQKVDEIHIAYPHELRRRPPLSQRRAVPARGSRQFSARSVTNQIGFTHRLTGAGRSASFFAVSNFLASRRRGNETGYGIDAARESGHGRRLRARGGHRQGGPRANAERPERLGRPSRPHPPRRARPPEGQAGGPPLCLLAGRGPEAGSSGGAPQARRHVLRRLAERDDERADRHVRARTVRRGARTAREGDRGRPGEREMIDAAAWTLAELALKSTLLPAAALRTSRGQPVSTWARTSSRTGSSGSAMPKSSLRTRRSAATL